MAISTHTIIFPLFMSAAIYTVSATTCADICKVSESSSAIRCARPCKFDATKMSSLSSVFGDDIVDSCLTACNCGQEFIYPTDRKCKNLQAFALIHASQQCGCSRGGNERAKRDASTKNPWENWCKHQCAQGLGGSACYCDIIP